MIYDYFQIIYHINRNFTTFCMLIFTTTNAILQNSACWYIMFICDMIIQSWTLSNALTQKKIILQNSASWFMITYKYNFLLLICDMIVQTWTLSNTLPPKTQCYKILQVDIWYDHSDMIIIKTLPHKAQCYKNLHGFTLYNFWFTAKIEMSCMHRHNMINRLHLSAKSFVT